MTTNAQDHRVAIIGMSCKFPGANNLNEFWDNLLQGKETISHKHTKSNEYDYIEANGKLDEVEYFDAEYFKMSAREARITSPQHRLFLECAHEALEHSGYDSHQYQGDIGIYAGGDDTNYEKIIRQKESDFCGLSDWEVLFGTSKDYMLARAAYKLNLKGPAIVVEAACATSMVAIHTAIQGLLSGDCDIALAGAATVHYPEKVTPFVPGGIISKDGHCRTFDSNANGTVGSDGVGMVVLKPLNEAIKDKDTIYAVINGTAINNDGTHRIGFTAPSIEGEARAIKSALSKSGLSADQISYVEAHGTATPLGDPIEVAALKKVYSQYTKKYQYCAIGSVKTNIGHTGAAAGMAGMIKTVLALWNEKIPPSLHYTNPNPEIDFKNSPFWVVDTVSNWPRNNKPRRAGVSSFGIGGTNSHAILEESPSIKQVSSTHKWHLLPISAETPKALKDVINNLKVYLTNNKSINLSDVAFTLQTGRREHTLKCALVVNSVDDALNVMSDNNSARILHCKGDNHAYLSKNIDECMLMNIAKKWISGEKIDWDIHIPHKNSRRIALPSYPYQKERFSIDITEAVTKDKMITETCSNDVTSEIIQLYKNILGNNNIDKDSKFFDIGGDSFIAISLFERINTKFSIELDPFDIFKSQTPAEISDLVRTSVNGMVQNV